MGNSKKWNEQSALKVLGHNVEVNGKFLVATGGLNGLQQCSASDYLTNHCGYTYIYRRQGA